MWKQLLFAGQLTGKARLLAGLAGMALVGAIFLPLWQMTMVSNQYPHGLRVFVYAYTLTGDLQEINTLNHYIGMIPIDTDHFVALKVLPALFVIGAVLCLLAAIRRRRDLTSLVLVGGLAAGVASMFVLFYELYSIGHTLDRHAPIRIKPFMPPPMGSYQLANFHVTTFLHFGSGLFALAIVLLVASLWISRSKMPTQPVATPSTVNSWRRSHRATHTPGRT